MNWCAPPFILALAVVFAPVSAHGAEPDEKEQAIALYGRASDLTRSGRCADAVPLLERSYARMESPNTALLLARCSRDLGKVEQAFSSYEVAIRQADERVARGELRYAATATAAREEMAALPARSVVAPRLAPAPASAAPASAAPLANGRGTSGLHRAITSGFLHRAAGPALLHRGEKTIANVGLAVGIVALAAGGTLLLIHALQRGH